MDEKGNRKRKTNTHFLVWKNNPKQMVLKVVWEEDIIVQFYMKKREYSTLNDKTK